MCVQLTKKDGDRIAQAGWAFNHYYSREWIWTTMIYQQGGYLYTEDGTQALCNSEEAVRALQFIAGPLPGPRRRHRRFPDHVRRLRGGVAATYISHGYTGSGWTEDEFPDLTWGTACPPRP